VDGGADLVDRGRGLVGGEGSRGDPLLQQLDLERKVVVALGVEGGLTEGFTGAEVSSVVNVAISFVLQEYLKRYSSPEEAARHTSEAFISMKDYENAVRKIKKQRDTSPDQRVTVPYYH
jgi:SpoVK/Ycf46/Vps4 family AAA+-type ATPase